MPPAVAVYPECRHFRFFDSAPLRPESLWPCQATSRGMKSAVSHVKGQGGL